MNGKRNVQRHKVPWEERARDIVQYAADRKVSIRQAAKMHGFITPHERPRLPNNTCFLLSVEFHLSYDDIREFFPRGEGDK